ncbi:MAG: diacylglycerol kinase family lipid kinase [Crocinitomicaceae bacterium]|jgi:YegS/Rv2252/BmrU family lipid kinase|nr:diacylglycerol kinase family lipid kinase [Crocinitomicaceae bacterium]
MKLKIRFIINPKSGVHDKHDLPGLIATHLDQTRFDYDIRHTQYRKHAEELAKETAELGYHIACAVGGDGSVHEVGTGLIGSNTALAILPAGSGNGLARHLGIPLVLEKAIQHLNHAETKFMDTVRANDKSFLNVGGYGFDALIARKFDKYHRRGFWGYAQLIVREFFKYQPKEYSFEINGEKRKENLILFTVANASEFGNGLCISPESKIDDGQLELCLMKPFRGWKAPGVIRYCFKRKTQQSKYVEIIPFSELRVTVPKASSHYDGEPFDIRTEIHIQVIPKSLPIFV